METCASCGAESKTKLLHVFVDERIEERLPFCLDCIEYGACELPLYVQAKREGPTLIDSALRSNQAMLRELRRSRMRASALEQRVAALEQRLAEATSGLAGREIEAA